MMNPYVYRWCAVPQCTNTSIKTPKKLFIQVPRKENIRNTWLKLARRDSANIAPSSVLYFCEDHFDLPNDMENYIKYCVMGAAARVRMKPGCIPKKYECQPDRRKRTSNITERSYVIKKQRRMLIQECEKDLTQATSTQQLETIDISSESSVLHTIEDEVPTTYPESADKSVQVIMRRKFRSKAVQTEVMSINQFTSPIKPEHKSVSTSPFKIVHCPTHTIKPGISNLYKTSKFTIEEQSDIRDSLYTPTQEEISPSMQFLPIQSSDCSEVIEEEKKEEASNIIKYTVMKIMKNPRSYMGLPKNCLYLIELIATDTQIPVNHVLLCLKKIRLNSPFRELADDFSISTTYASKVFFKSIPMINSVMRPFIVKLDSVLTKRTLPMAFRHKFHKTSCIIDCLEIEIQKPSKAVNQALSWSDYKKANTIKYLVSCTPNGLVNYVSPGYGGRVTDTCLVESCDFIKHLEPGMSVMADRGFKHVEQYLYQHKVQLVRPPSVVTGKKLSKSEVKETKQIASLRIHVERVIRRLREFHMLKPHACLNPNFVKILDEIIQIACALINLQDSLIK
ncbi:uncharacterized protein LOC112055435 [Bicyclus anynana]|uniref:Uncharacterized protein LOC112055435 n=1 Tax=Bicyclus anynana TaxID=110368 RepID=A0A6J1NX78_BICAN|nr:uncharacterized protein LOC112055435 [Bicyclus anynana]